MTNLTEFIARDGDNLVTDSRAVAIAFGKRHSHVLRTIDRMRLSARPLIAAHSQTNFGPAEFTDAQGKPRSMYRMTADGLSELAMSFTGDDAREVRIRFIAAFREVSLRLAEREHSITEQLHALARREAPLEAKGRIGSKLMLERKREKPEFSAERALLEALAQPSLLS